MNRVIMVVFALAFSAPLAVAQAMPDASSDSNAIAGHFRLHTFRGCLSHSGDQYDLTVAGALPRQYRLVGSNLAQLDSKAGHLISVTGTMLDSSQSGAMSADTSNAESDTINFLSADDIASTCNFSSGAAPAAETPRSLAGSSASGRQPWQLIAPSVMYIPMPGPPPQPGSYMIVPLVGALALGLLQMARHRRRK